MSPEQGWDLIWFIAGGAIALVFAVPIAHVIRDKLYKRWMRRHFDDTRGRRGSAKDRGERRLGNDAPGLATRTGRNGAHDRNES
jgi:hypothetical protein